MTYRRLRVTVLMLLLVATPVWAAEETPIGRMLASGLLFVPAGYSAGCNVTNLANHTVQVQIQLRDLDGTVIAGPGLFSLDPAHSNGVGVAIQVSSYFARCEVISRETKRDLRAVIQVVNNSTGVSIATLAVE